MSDSESERHQRGFRVCGRVQGVGFRWWTRRRASDLGLRGTVRNRPDGSVEIHAAGEPDMLEAFAVGTSFEAPRRTMLSNLLGDGTCENQLDNGEFYPAEQLTDEFGSLVEDTPEMHFFLWRTLPHRRSCQENARIVGGINRDCGSGPGSGGSLPVGAVRRTLPTRCVVVVAPSIA